MINKGEDMKMISHHFGWLADFKYIAVITDSSLKMTYAICCVLQILFKRKKAYCENQYGYFAHENVA